MTTLETVRVRLMRDPGQGSGKNTTSACDDLVFHDGGGPGSNTIWHPNLAEPISALLFADGLYEPDMIAGLLSRLSHKDVFLDVSANIGAIALFIAAQALLLSLVYRLFSLRRCSTPLAVIKRPLLTRVATILVVPAQTGALNS